MQPITEFYPQFAKPHKAVITTHQKPDGDAMGSALGLYHFLVQLGHDVTVISPTNWADFLKWMPGCNKVIDFEGYRDKAINIVRGANVIYCVDFNILHRTKHLQHIIRNSNTVKVMVDHHELPETNSFSYGISNPYKSSTAEMVYDVIMEAGYASSINLNVAACLYTGAMTDTGSFRFPSASASVHRMVAHFKELGLNHTAIHENVYDNFLETRLRFIGNALVNRLNVLYEYNTAMMAIPKSDLVKYDIKTGDTEGLVNYLLSIEGIKLGALLIDREEERRWSFRSKGTFDVNIFARLHFEGGGHKNAAGGRSSDTLDNNIKRFISTLKEYEQQLQSSI